MDSIDQLLLEYGFYHLTADSVSAAFSVTQTPATPDFIRLQENKPYWPKSALNKTLEHKIIVVSDWQLAQRIQFNFDDTNSKKRKKLYPLLSLLFKKGFTIYITTGEELFELDESLTLLSTIRPIEHKETMAQIKQKGLKFVDTKILDWSCYNFYENIICHHKKTERDTFKFDLYDLANHENFLKKLTILQEHPFDLELNDLDHRAVDKLIDYLPTILTLGKSSLKAIRLNSAAFCDYFSENSCPQLEKICFSYDDSIEKIRKIAPNCPNIKDLDLSLGETSETNLNEILALFPNLEKLSFTANEITILDNPEFDRLYPSLLSLTLDCNEYDEGLPWILKHCPNLKKLKLNNGPSDFSKLNANLNLEHPLKELTISGMEGSAIALYQFIGKFPQLTNIKITSSFDFDFHPEEALQPLGLKQLQSLKIDIGKLSTHAIALFIDQSPRLEKLCFGNDKEDINQYSQLIDVPNQNVLSKFPSKIKKLWIPSRNSQVIKKLLALAPEIVELEITNNDNVETISGFDWPVLDKLKTLKLMEVDIDFIDFCDLLNKCPNAEKIVFDGTLVNAPLENLMARKPLTLKSVKYFNFNTNALISKNLISYLLYSMPNLEKLEASLNFEDIEELELESWPNLQKLKSYKYLGSPIDGSKSYLMTKLSESTAPRISIEVYDASISGLLPKDYPKSSNDYKTDLSPQNNPINFEQLISILNAGYKKINLKTGHYSLGDTSSHELQKINLPSLHQLKQLHFSTEIDISIFNYILQNALNLTALHVRQSSQQSKDYETWLANPVLPMLKKLTIESPTNVKVTQSLLAFLSKLPRLQQLSIDIKQESNQPVNEIIENISLESLLKLEANATFTKLFIPYTPNLISLKLIPTDFFVFDDIIKILEQLPKLTSLQLVDPITTEEMEILNESFPDINIHAIAVPINGITRTHPLRQTNTDIEDEKDITDLNPDLRITPNKTFDIVNYFYEKENASNLVAFQRTKTFKEKHSNPSDVIRIADAQPPALELGDALELEYYNRYKNDPQVYSSIPLDLQLIPNEWRSLPSLSANEELIYIVPSELIQYGYSTSQNRWKIKLPADVSEKRTVHIFFGVQSKILFWNPRPDIIKDPAYLMAYNLFGQLKLIDDDRFSIPVTVLEDNAFQQLKTIKPYALMSALRAYLYSFGEGNEPLNPADLRQSYQRILNEKVGRCSHRAKLGFIIASALGLKVTLEESKSHAFFNFFYIDKWYICDPGGFPAHQNVTNIQSPSHFQQLEKQIPQNTGFNKLIKQNAEKEIVKKLEKTQQDTHTVIQNNRFIKKHLQRPKFNSFFELWAAIIQSAASLPSRKKNILITFPSAEALMGFQQMVMQNQTTINNDYYYVHSLDDIAFQSMKVANNSFTPVASSMVQAIHHSSEQNIFIMNVTKLAGEFVGYNTVFDDNKRHLKHHELHPGMIVLGYQILDPSKKLGDEIESRFKVKFHCELDLKPTLIQINENIETLANAPTINLYGGYHWRKELEGTISIEGQTFNFKGALLTLLEKYKEEFSCLQLHNPPMNDPEFQLFCLELMLRKRFWANGEWHAVPANFKIQFSKSPYTFEGKYRVYDFIPHEPCPWHYPLNHSTYDLFFDSYRVHENNIYTTPGLLATHQHLILLVTAIIADNLWQRLIDTAMQHSCHLDFYLAPGVEVPRAIKDKIQIVDKSAIEYQPQKKKIKTSAQAHIIETNNKYYASDVLLKQLNRKAADCIIITVNQETEYNYLIEKVIVEKNPTTGWYLFQNRSTTVLQGLLDINNPAVVILQGSFSPALLANLESLFAERAYLRVNNEKQTINGKIYLISEEANLMPFVAERQTLTLDDSQLWDILAADHHPQQVKELQMVCTTINLAFSYAQCKTILQRMNQGISLYQILKGGFLPLQNMHHYLATLKQLKNYFAMPVKPKYSLDEIEKRLIKIDKLLQQHPFLCLVGTTGTGKSSLILDHLQDFYLRQGKNIQLFVGMDKVCEWSKPIKNNEPHFLYLDEVNTYGGHERFENWPFVLNDDGEYIQLTAGNYFIIASQNFKEYARRKESFFFANCGRYHVIKDFPESYIKVNILGKLMVKLNPQFSQIQQQQIINQFYNLYNYVNRELKPKNHLSIRNLKMMVLRLSTVNHALLQKKLGVSGDLYLNLITLFACYDEIKNYLDTEQKEQFKQAVNLRSNARYKRLKESVIKSPNKVKTQSQLKVLAVIEDHIRMRQLLLKNPELKVTKNHMTIEGESGNGKSTLIRNYLLSLGFKEVQPLQEDFSCDTRMQFVCLTPSDPDEIKKAVTFAFHRGMIVVNDEANTVPLEEFFNQLKGGFDLDGKRAIKSGYMQFDTQNDCFNYEDRIEESTAELNRVDKVILQGATQEELVEIAMQCFQLPEANSREIVSEYLSARNAVNKGVVKMPKPTPRDLYSEVEIEKQRLKR